MAQLDPGTGYPVCQNPQCRRFGHSHPNCHCYLKMARGGAVKGPGEDHFCFTNRLHETECPYFASGGPVEGQEEVNGMEPAEHPDLVAGHYTLNKGLSGLLSKAGHSNSPDPIKHLHDYHDEAKRGKKRLEGHINNLYNTNKLDIEQPDVEPLKNRLQELEEKPDELMEIGGQLGASMPEHATQIGEKAAKALTYFKTIRPMNTQVSPLDEPLEPDSFQMSKYNRQLSLAENPSLLFQHIKSGILLPQDLETLQTIHPHLLKSMTDQAMEALVDAKARGKQIPYRQRQSLAMLLNEPLDFTQTPQAMQAIIASAAPQQAQRQPQPKKDKKKGQHGLTAQDLKQLDKVDQLSETPLEARQINKNKD
jgi:hypothetical protein